MTTDNWPLNIDHFPVPNSLYTEDSLAFRRNPLRGPWWIPDHLDIGFLHTGQIEQLELRIRRDRRTHAAALSGERHLYFDSVRCFGQWPDLHFVNQAEVDDVHGYLRVIAGFQDLPYTLFQGFTGQRLRGSGLLFRRDGLADGIGILVSKPEQSAVAGNQ